MSSSLLGLPRPRLRLLLQEEGEPPYRGEQIFRWLHARRASAFGVMSDLPAGLRHRLAQRYSLSRPRVSSRQDARDGTSKWLLELSDGARVEAVLMPSDGRLTLCLSTQVGCAYGCSFCATATMGKLRDLSAAEIVGQVLTLLDEDAVSSDRVWNAVFMGMGEPLDNADAVLDAFDILTDPVGFNLSWRRITLSTVGHVDGIRRLAQRDRRPRLAVSLNATTDELRSRLMPVNRKWPLKALREALAGYPVRPGEKVTLEYVLMAGENDTLADARRLTRLIHGLPARVNLIPWNPCPGLPHTLPDDTTVAGFRDALLARGVNASIRFSKGVDAAAACGQLVTAQPVAPRSCRP